MRKPVFASVNNKGADQPAHLHSLISTSFVRFLDSMTPAVAMYLISRP